MSWEYWTPESDKPERVPDWVAVIAAKDAEIERLRIENARLDDENFMLSTWQCEFTDGKTGLVASEGGSTYCAMAREVEALKADLNTFMKIANAEAAEAERLRAALDTIGRMKVMPDDVMNRTTLVAALHIARAALEGKQ